MEERRFFPAHRILRRLPDTFVPVAGRATEAQVVGSRPTPDRQRYDVVDLEGHTQQCLGAATVGAAAPAWFSSCSRRVAGMRWLTQASPQTLGSGARCIGRGP